MKSKEGDQTEFLLIHNVVPYEQYWLLCLMSPTAYSTAVAFMVFMPTAVQEIYHVDLEEAGLITGLAYAVALVASIVSGLWVRFNGDVPQLLLMGCSALAVSYMAMSISLPAYLVVCVMGLGLGILPRAIWFAISKVTHWRTVEHGYSILTAIHAIGIVVFSPLLGHLRDETLDFTTGLVFLILFQGFSIVISIAIIVFDRQTFDSILELSEKSRTEIDDRRRKEEERRRLMEDREQQVEEEDEIEE
eukprot:TRINITY_DN5213_c0_g1_i2.p1 TRINITY_DN5213_c0_g1~~TRINITY_DN5213_c0_g1_i2.p1  ORF type:complete len:247 (-),score=68.56 TRINITY_DN5213_c0_g1_i2:491-1231(-)